MTVVFKHRLLGIHRNNTQVWDFWDLDLKFSASLSKQVSCRTSVEARSAGRGFPHFFCSRYGYSIAAGFVFWSWTLDWEPVDRTENSLGGGGGSGVSCSRWWEDVWQNFRPAVGKKVWTCLRSIILMWTGEDLPSCFFFFLRMLPHTCLF